MMGKKVLSNLVRRTYALSGLDRKLYRVEPQWPEGTFHQATQDEGQLSLLVRNVQSPEELDAAKAQCDRVAEKFRLAIARRIGRPVTAMLKNSSEPSFEVQDRVLLTAHIQVTATASDEVMPREPPEKIEQIPEVAARWILTLTEASSFGAYPDEVLKRLYLLIEELKEEHAHVLNYEQRRAIEEVKWIRDFVSHSACNNQALCAFVGKQLPSAVAGTFVRFDRTNINHRNFVGRYDPIARSIANSLLDAAISALSSTQSC